MSRSTTSTPLLPSGVSAELEYLQPHQVHEAASLLVDTFLNYTADTEDPSPLYAWVFEDLLLDDPTAAAPPRFRRQRQRLALHWLFCKNLEAHLQLDASAKRKTACRCAFLHEQDQPSKMICFFILSSHPTETKTNDDCTNCFGAGNFSSIDFLSSHPTKTKTTNDHLSCHPTKTENTTDCTNCCFGVENFSSIDVFSSHPNETKKSNIESEITWWTMVRHGVLRFPLLFGWKTFYRLIITDDFYHSRNANYLVSQGNMGYRSYRLLERMAVHSSMHGKGIGRYFLQKALSSEEEIYDDDLADFDDSKKARNDGCCLLHTDKKQAVAFYLKLGFAFVEKDDFESHRFAPGVTTWMMVLSPSIAIEA